MLHCNAIQISLGCGSNWLELEKKKSEPNNSQFTLGHTPSVVKSAFYSEVYLLCVMHPTHFKMHYVIDDGHCMHAMIYRSYAIMFQVPDGKKLCYVEPRIILAPPKLHFSNQSNLSKICPRAFTFGNSLPIRHKGGPPCQEGDSLCGRDN